MLKSLKLIPLMLAIGLTACSEKPAANAPTAPESQPASVPAAAAAPAVSATVVAATPSPAFPKADAAVLAKGETIYNQTCQACHAAGVMGAPKIGDKTSWEPHLAKGLDTLHTNAINGFKMMPPKGGNAMLKEPDVQAAVDFMISKVN